MNYEVYSWQESDGKWTFSLVGSPSGVYTSIETVFDKRFIVGDLDDLKRKLSTLPKGSSILWINGPVRGDEDRIKKLKNPPPKLKEEIRQFSKEHGISLEP